MERINTSIEWKKSNKLHNIAIIAAMILALSSCTSKEEQYEKQLQKVYELENEIHGLQNKLTEQANNYEMVSIDENLQQDLKRNWADPSINQEIWYALDRASERDKEIAETKEDLGEAQSKLAKAKEKLAMLKWELENDRQIQSKKLDTRLNPDKYDYIKEYEKSQNN